MQRCLARWLRHSCSRLMANRKSIRPGITRGTYPTRWSFTPLNHEWPCTGIKGRSGLCRRLRSPGRFAGSDPQPDQGRHDAPHKRGGTPSADNYLVEAGFEVSGARLEGAEGLIEGQKSTPQALKRDHILNGLTARLKRLRKKSRSQRQPLKGWLKLND